MKRKLIVVMCLFLLFFSWDSWNGECLSATVESEQVMAQFQDTVKKLSETRDYPDAIQRLEKLVENHPNCEASLYISRSLLNLSRVYFNKEGISKDVANKKIKAIAEKGLDVLKHVREQRGDEADSWPIYYYAGIFHEALDQNTQALDMFRKVATGAYDARVKASAYFGMCKLFIKQGMWSDADSMYQKLSSKLKKKIEHWYPNLKFDKGHISITQPESASKRRDEVEEKESTKRIPGKSKIVIDNSRISTEAKVLTDFSSPAATLRTYIRALKAGDVDTLYDSFSEEAKRAIPLLQSKEKFARRITVREKGRKVNEEERDIMIETFASQIEREFNEVKEERTSFKYKSGIEKGLWERWEVKFVKENGQWKIEMMGK